MILITGYPYIRENYFQTLRHYPKKDALVFLLPESWPIKNGKIIYHPPKDENVRTAKAFFYHSNYPIIGGLLKGFMPGFLPFLLANKSKMNIKTVVTLTEPILLTTLYQAFWSKILGLRHFLFSWENIDPDKKFFGFNGWLKKGILRLNLYWSDGIICGNKKAAAIMKKYTDKPAPVIPYAGIDTDFFKPSSGKKEFRGVNYDGNFVYSFVGAIEARKGIRALILAFAEVIKKEPNSRLIIAGSGHDKYEKEIDELITERKLENFIAKIAWVSHEELKQLFAVSDVFVYPSLPNAGWAEQMGYAMLEASAAGLPVISTDSGSIDEVVINDQTGFLVEPDNFEQLASEMLKLKDDDQLRKLMGENGRNFVLNNFSSEKIAGRLYEFLNKYDK